jgi:MinD superfamily P-loop ATPase
MKQLVILSGKGGTGKTTLSAAFSRLTKDYVVADCDVDAADLFILLKPDRREELPFYGGKKAAINSDACSRCGLCVEVCRFEAIKDFSIDEVLCEGCGFCCRVCPDKAIDFQEVFSGSLYDSTLTDGTKFLHAKLSPGEGNSGKLVTEIKKKAHDYCLHNRETKNLLMIDGPPGIGCPVNASLTGADEVLLITEPTLSGLHDLKRIVFLIQSFGISAKVVINKYDLNSTITKEIKEYLESEHIPLIGTIPFDEGVVTALQQEKSILEFPESEAARAIAALWNTLQSAKEQK